MRDGWGAEAMFPPIPGLAPRQHNQLFVVMVPPNLRLMFAPGAVSYTLAIGPAATFAPGDRVTGGGWIWPRFPISPSALRRSEGASKIWAQDVPVNNVMQAGRPSRFMPDGVSGPLETTLVQFNALLLRVAIQWPRSRCGARTTLCRGPRHNR
jgi:hypothetical protein